MIMATVAEIKKRILSSPVVSTQFRINQVEGLQPTLSLVNLPKSSISDNSHTGKKEQYRALSFDSLMTTPLKRCAVLIPLIYKGGRLSVLLTKRSMKVRHHKGHVSFPGGKFDESCDSIDVDTALREAEEEVGLVAKYVEVIGQLVPLISAAGYIITPIIAMIQEFDPILNTDEVEEVFYLPLERFLSEDRHWYVDSTASDYRIPVHYFKDTVNGEEFCTWGITALICISLAIIVYGRLTDFLIDSNIEVTTKNPTAVHDAMLDYYYFKRKPNTASSKL